MTDEVQSETQRVLRAAMDDRKTSVRRLADESGVSASTIAAHSAGWHVRSRVDTLVALAQALEIDPLDLINAQSRDAGVEVVTADDRSSDRTDPGMSDWNRLGRRMSGAERQPMTRLVELLLGALTAMTPPIGTATGEFCVRSTDDEAFLFVVRHPPCGEESEPVRSVGAWIEAHRCPTH